MMLAFSEIFKVFENFFNWSKKKSSFSQKNVISYFERILLHQSRGASFIQKFAILVAWKDDKILKNRILDFCQFLDLLNEKRL